MLKDGVSFSALVAGWSMGLGVAVFAGLVGAIPALVLGSPSYAILVLSGRATYITSFLLGVIPGSAIYFYDRDLGLFFLLFGVPTAMLTHHLYLSRVKKHGPGL